MNYNLNADTGHFGTAIKDAELRHTVISRALAANWRWVSAYVIVTLLGLVGAYYLDGWLSFTVSIGVDFSPLLSGCSW